MIGTVLTFLKGRMPGQLVIQITDRCNATCPQCGMRTTSDFPRTRLSTERIKAIIDAAGEKGIQALSFTGGEPMLLRKDLPELIRHAGKAGIPYIRTGTNGFFSGTPGERDLRTGSKPLHPSWQIPLFGISGSASTLPTRAFTNPCGDLTGWSGA